MGGRLAFVGNPRDLPVPETPPQPDLPTIELKDPAFAALLAWLVPGLGHWYQGRRAKAVLFFVCITGLFFHGVYLGGGTCLDRQKEPKERFLGYGRAVYFSWKKEDRRLPYLCQVWVGLPAMPAIIQANLMNNGRKVIWGGFMAPPRSASIEENDPNKNQPTAHDLNNLLARYYELATCFTMVAGLLNVLAIYDAWAGPVVGHPAKKEEEEKEDKGKEETA
jgi:hypothetical protein